MEDTTSLTSFVNSLPTDLVGALTFIISLCAATLFTIIKRLYAKFDDLQATLRKLTTKIEFLIYSININDKMTHDTKRKIIESFNAEDDDSR